MQAVRARLVRRPRGPGARGARRARAGRRPIRRPGARRAGSSRRGAARRGERLLALAQPPELAIGALDPATARGDPLLKTGAFAATAPAEPVELVTQHGDIALGLRALAAGALAIAVQATQLEGLGAREALDRALALVDERLQLLGLDGRKLRRRWHVGQPSGTVAAERLADPVGHVHILPRHQGALVDRALLGLDRVAVQVALVRLELALVWVARQRDVDRGCFLLGLPERCGEHVELGLVAIVADPLERFARGVEMELAAGPGGGHVGRGGRRRRGRVRPSRRSARRP